MNTDNAGEELVPLAASARGQYSHPEGVGGGRGKVQTRSLGQFALAIWRLSVCGIATEHFLWHRNEPEKAAV